MKHIGKIINTVITHVKRKLKMQNSLRRARLYREARVVSEYQCELFVANLLAKLMLKIGEDVEIIPAGSDTTFRESLMFDVENVAIWYSVPLKGKPEDFTTGLIMMQHNSKEIKDYSEFIDRNKKKLLKAQIW